MIMQLTIYYSGTQSIELEMGPEATISDLIAQFNAILNLADIQQIHTELVDKIERFKQTYPKLATLVTNMQYRPREIIAPLHMI